MKDITKSIPHRQESEYINYNQPLDLWLDRAQEALTPEHLKSWSDGIRDSWDIPKMVASYMLPNLTNLYITRLNEKIGVWDRLILEKPFLEIEHNNQGKIRNINLCPEATDKVHTQLKSYISNMMDQENIWEGLIKWFWNHSLSWTLGIMNKNFGTETQFRMSDRDWAEAYSKLLCHSELKYFNIKFDLYARHFSELLVDSLEVNVSTLSTLEDFLKLRDYRTSQPNLMPAVAVDEGTSYITSFNMAHFQQLRKVIAACEFSLKENRLYPQVNLNTSSGRDHGTAILNPNDPDKNLTTCRTLDMNDETVDVLDALCHLWLKNANKTDSLLSVSADEILQLRGLREQKNGQGTRGGYKQEWRQRIAKHVCVLSNTSITSSQDGSKYFDNCDISVSAKNDYLHRVIILAEIPTSSTDNKNEFRWLLRPGVSFAKHLSGSWRQTALLSKKILQFDPYRQAYEKRAGRYFSWLWRSRQSKALYLEPIRVRTILESISMNYQKSRPSKVIERFEKMMDTLLDEEVINAWQYENVFHNWHEWLELKVAVEPPQAIMNHYHKIKSPSKKCGTSNDMNSRTKISSLTPQELITERQRRSITQMQAAEEIGIDQSTISKLENGRQHADRRSVQKIKKWMNQVPFST